MKISLFNSQKYLLSDFFLNTLSIFVHNIFFPFSTLEEEKIAKTNSQYTLDFEKIGLAIDCGPSPQWARLLLNMPYMTDWKLVAGHTYLLPTCFMPIMLNYIIQICTALDYGTPL